MGVSCSSLGLSVSSVFHIAIDACRRTKCRTGRDLLTRIASLAVTSVQEGDWGWMALKASEELDLRH